MHDNYARSKFLTEFLDSLDGFYWPPATKEGRPKDSSLISLGSTSTTLICINHAKEVTKKAGAKTYTAWRHVGGAALDFHACLQFMIKCVGFEDDEFKNVKSQKINVCADKNKMAPPKRECLLSLSFVGGGITQIGTMDWLSIAVTKGLAEKAGAGWVKSHILLPDGKIQGAEAFNKYIENNPEKRALIAD